MTATKHHCQLEESSAWIVSLDHCTEWRGQIKLSLTDDWQLALNKQLTDEWRMVTGNSRLSNQILLDCINDTPNDIYE